MEGNYTTLLKQQKLDLSDVYYMSCEASKEGEQKEFALTGTVTKIVLVATLTVGSGNYSVQAKDFVENPKDIPSLTIGFGERNRGHQQFSSVDNGKLSLEVNRAPSYQPESRRVREANLDRLERTQRMELLMTSFQKNRTSEPIPFSSRMTMRVANRLLCILPFMDSILQYNKFDDVWHYNLFFNKDIEMSVSVYVDEDIMDDVDYSIYHNGELVVANTLPLQQLVKKMKAVIAKIQKNA